MGEWVGGWEENRGMSRRKNFLTRPIKNFKVSFGINISEGNTPFY